LIHRLSGRSGPFAVVDCSSIPEQLLESELFGHERGAFTGAEGRRIGRFEEAEKGTLLLDEIGELPIHLQPKLLRVLQESTVRRVGGDREIELDVRFIAATHRNLQEMVARGDFREDLFFRLRVMEIHMPPLRERGEDAVVLALYFLRQYCGELGREMMSISPEADAAIRAYAWPGNVRELINRVRRAVIICTGPELSPQDLQLTPTAANGAANVVRRRSPSSGEHPPLAMAPPPPAPIPVPAISVRSATLPREGPPSTLEENVAEWFWEHWADSSKNTAPQDLLEAFMLRTALVTANGSLKQAAKLMDMHVDTFSSHLERLGHPSLSRSVRQSGLADALTRALGEPPVPDAPPLTDRVLTALLKELLVLCHGNKSEMARYLGWGRRTLSQHLRRLIPAAPHEADGD
jgi:DNA-binding NtrC family response regulator